MPELILNQNFNTHPTLVPTTNNKLHGINVLQQIHDIIILRLMNFNESQIDESNITMEFHDMHTKGSLFLDHRSSNFITYGFLKFRMQ